MANWSARLPAWAESTAAANARGRKSRFMDSGMDQSSVWHGIQTGSRTMSATAGVSPRSDGLAIGIGWPRKHARVSRVPTRPDRRWSEQL